MYCKHYDVTIDFYVSHLVTLIVCFVNKLTRYTLLKKTTIMSLNRFKINNRINKSIINIL